MVRETTGRITAVLPQKLAQQLSVYSSVIGLVAHRQVHPRLLIHDALGVGEDVEALLAVVSAHAALTNASEAHLTGGQMDDGVVDAATAVGAAGSHLADTRAVGGKQVKGQPVRSRT